MIELLALADPVAEATGSTYVGPGAMLLAALGLLAAAAKFYKEARQIDAEGEKNRRIAAETREKESSTSTAARVKELSDKVDSLEDKIDQLRIDHERELLAERGKNFQLRKMLTDRGVEIPEELGPK